MKSSLLLAGLLLGSVASVATASGPGATLTAPGDAYASQPYTLGYLFTLGGNASVTKLGVYDWNQDGLESSAMVGLWTDSGTLLAAVGVGAGTSGELIGSFRYTNIAPIALTAGSSYVVGSYMDSSVVGTASSFGTGQGGGGFFNPLITFAQDRYSNFDAAFGFPAITDGLVGGAWTGGNVVFDVVPEPASWAMLIAGFGLTGAAMRRRRQGRVSA
jgi:hypothetical protein